MSLRLIALVLGFLLYPALMPEYGHAHAQTAAEPQTQLEALSAENRGLREENARLRLDAPDPVTRRQTIGILAGLTGAFALCSMVVFVLLARSVRRILIAHGEAAGSEGWKTYLNMPLGVPDGSVRALVSLFVIIFGLVVLVLQKQIGISNVEAISGFIGIVITFYFTARSGNEAQKVGHRHRPRPDTQRPTHDAYNRSLRPAGICAILEDRRRRRPDQPGPHA